MICWLVSTALWWIGLIVVIMWLFFWITTATLWEKRTLNFLVWTIKED